jgi:MHS family proline/betaine transporter-like MFS transporter
MTIPTFLMGLLPTYQDIGIAAPIALILLRLCQGLSAGGEATGAVLFVMENNQYTHRGFIGGVLWGVVGIGMLLGSSAAMVVTRFSAYSWAWRIPFLLGIITGLIGYFVRKRTPESAYFKEALQQHTLVEFPLYYGIVHYKKEIVRIIGVYTLSAMITYIIFIFMPNYTTHVAGLSLSKSTVVSTISLACIALLVPLGGYLSDLIGRARTLRYAAWGFFLVSYPLFRLISTGSLHNLVIAEGIFIVLAAMFQGTITAFVIEQVPTAVRYSLVAVGYNLAYSIFGGTAPFLAGYLVKITNNPASPGLYLMFGAVVALISLPHTSNDRLLEKKPPETTK